MLFGRPSKIALKGIGPEFAATLVPVSLGSGEKP